MTIHEPRDLAPPFGDEASNGKISPEFARRLSHLKPDQRISAIVLLNIASARPPAVPHRSRAGRQAAIEAIRRTTEPALIGIDRILERTGGTRLTPQVDALGAISVEITTHGAHALAALKHVKAILENQPISGPSTPRHS